MTNPCVHFPFHPRGSFQFPFYIFVVLFSYRPSICSFRSFYYERDFRVFRKGLSRVLDLNRQSSRHHGVTRWMVPKGHWPQGQDPGQEVNLCGSPSSGRCPSRDILGSIQHLEGREMVAQDFRTEVGPKGRKTPHLSRAAEQFQIVFCEKRR